MSTRDPAPRSTSAAGRSPRVIDSTALMQAVSTAARTQGRTVGFVPTMGALHDGHLALIREARQRADVVVVSIFVNAMQFGQKEDLAQYPRTLDADLLACGGEAVDIVFAPTHASVYPEGFATVVKAGPIASIFEGASRPGHFDGVLTVVTKLFHLVQPHFAVFGEKDYQQLLLVQRLVRDLHLPVEIVTMPVMREHTGLALSSRNMRLDPKSRTEATCLYRGLVAAQELASEGETDGQVLVDAATEAFAGVPGFALDYVALVDPRTLEPMRTLDRTGRLLLAGVFSGPPQIRLIDNGPVFPS